jgi:hypothetical protein
MCADGSARAVHRAVARSTGRGSASAHRRPVRHGDRVDAVEALLARTGRIARRRDLLAAGVTRRSLQRRVRRGELRQLTPHLYTDVAKPSPDETLRAAAVALDAVVSHTSAALLWGLELATTPEQPTVTVARDQPRGSRRRRRPQGDVVARDWQHAQRRRVTTPARRCWTCAGAPAGRSRGGGDSALRRGLCAVGPADGAVRAAGWSRRVARRPGAGARRRPCGSVLESLLRVLAARPRDARTPTQLAVRGRGGALIGRWTSPGRRRSGRRGGRLRLPRRPSAPPRRPSPQQRARARRWRLLRFSWEDVVQHPSASSRSSGLRCAEPTWTAPAEDADPAAQRRDRGARRVRSIAGRRG